MTPYKGTIPFYVCEAKYGQCIEQSNTLEGDEKCKEGRESCGTKDPSPTTTSSTSTPSTTQTSTSTSSSDESSTSTEPTNTESAESPTETGGAVTLVQHYGLAGFATVVAAAFALL